MVEIAPPYLLFIGDVHDALAAKTAQGIVDWRPERCIGQFKLPNCKADLGIPLMSIGEAARQGARTMVIGVASAGGAIPSHWVPHIVEAIDAGMDVACGMHDRLSSIPEIAEAASARGRQLHDVRHSTIRFQTGKGAKRSGKRLLTVGTDCSVGKKYTVLALEKELQARGVDADFRATGQTGIFIAGRGVAVDAVVSDFISGAVEWLAPAGSDDHWDLIEGQGSLFHPSFAGVSLGLLHGAQPDLFVVCHEPTRTTMRGVAHPLPTIGEVIDLTVRCGQLTNPDIRCIGIAVNTQAYEESEARTYLEKTAGEYGLPATDPVRFGMSAIADAMLRE